jgi:hypothetical protein
MMIFESIAMMMAQVIPSEELALKIWAVVRLMSSLIKLVWFIKYQLLIDMSQKKARSAPEYSN